MMALFRYTAYTASGEKEIGEVEARSIVEALSLLTERGLLPSSTKEVNGTTATNSSRLSATWTNKLRLSDYGALTRDMAALVEAELPLDDCLRLMADHHDNSRLNGLIERLLASVVSGTALYQAFKDNAPDAPPIISGMLQAGEARGNLAPALNDLAQFLETQVETQSKISAALTYPIILTVTALFAMAIIMTILVPALLPLFLDTGVPLPTALVLGNAFSNLLADHWPLIAVALIATIALTLVAFKLEPVRQMADGLKIKFPLIGAMIRNNAIAIFARTLGTLLQNGVPLIQALQISSAVVPNRVIAAAIKDAIAQVQEGNKLADVLTPCNLFPAIALRFITIGEETSQLDKMLLHMATLYAKESSRQLDRVMTLLTPAITVVIGVAVGGLILSVMQAVLSVNDLALQ